MASNVSLQLREFFLRTAGIGFYTGCVAECGGASLGYGILSRLITVGRHAAIKITEKI